MGKWSKPTGRSGWGCANCGEVHETPPVLGQKSLDLDEFYPGEVFVVDSKSQEPEALQLGKWILGRTELTEGPICPECEYQHEKDEYEYGPLWQCADCEGEYSSETEADQCCSYNRTYEERQEMYELQQIENAKKLLAEKGFKVQEANAPEAGHRPMSAIKDW